MLLTAACVTASPASLEDRTLSYGCNDIVAVGNIENAAYAPSPSDNDLIGRGWITAKLHVRRTVRGGPLPPRLPVRYFAHTYMREDRDFMFVLTAADGGLEVATAQLMSAHPRAVSTC